MWTSHDSGGGAWALDVGEQRGGLEQSGVRWLTRSPWRCGGGVGERRREEGGLCALILLQSDSIPSENGFFNASISCFENAN